MPKYVSYCAHCECIIDDDDDCDLHWFEKDFCSFECFKSYCLVSTMQCYECEMPVSSQVWYFVKSLPKLFIHRKKRPNSSECDNITNRLLFLFDDFIFCSEDCEKRHTNKHSLCGFCSIELEEEQPTNDRSTAFCSPTCVRLMNIHLGVKSVKQAKCSVCRELKDVQTGMFWEGDKYVTCSDDCFRMFKKSVNTKCEFCRQCLQPFKIESDDGFVVAENGQQSIFCSSTCMVFFMSHNETTAKCATCGVVGRFYQMIRGSINEVRAWCSLYCLREDQHDSSEHFLNEPSESSERNDKLVLMEQFPENCDENNNQTTTVEKCLNPGKMKPLTKFETEKLLETREAHCVSTCSSCDTKIATAKPFYRWHMMTFCSSLCIEFALKINSGTRCLACDNLIAVSKLFVYTEYVENELQQFCSDQCITNYLAVIQMCQQCQTILKRSDENGVMLCSKQCEEDFDKIFSSASTSEEKHCSDCDKLKPVKFNMLYNGKSYPFCSFACFFFVKFSCGICADSCAICKSYFVQNTSESFNVFYGTKVIMLCSSVCQSHFIQTHQLMVSCSFCEMLHFDSYMLQFICERGTKVHCFCSMSCYDLFMETTPKCMPIEASDRELQELRDKLKKKQESVEVESKFKTVATQTDEVETKCNCSCTCTKDNVRRILVPKKRLSIDPNGTCSLGEHSNVQPFKIPRRE